MKKSKKLTIAQKAKKAGIPAQTVYNRMHHGWHEKKALSVPVRKKAVRPNALERPKKVEPKFAFNDAKGKVEPKKAPSPLSQRMKKEIPIPVEKYEGNKTAMHSPRMVVISLAVILVLVVLVVVNT